MSGSEPAESDRHEDAIIEQVRLLALRLARQDRGLNRRGDVSAEDIAQQVCVKFARLESGPESWEAWTRRATRNRLVDLARNHERHPWVDDDELTRRVRHVNGPRAQVIAKRQIGQVLASLTAAEKRVLADRVAGYSNADIAERHGYASPASVSTVLSRLKKKIKDEFPDLRVDLAAQRPYHLN